MELKLRINNILSQSPRLRPMSLARHKIDSGCIRHRAHNGNNSARRNEATTLPAGMSNGRASSRRISHDTSVDLLNNEFGPDSMTMRLGCQQEGYKSGTTLYRVIKHPTNNVGFAV